MLTEKTNFERLYEVLVKIRLITGINDIACHGIKEGQLCPVYKFDTEMLSIDNWKESHKGLGLKIKGHKVLEPIVNNKNTFYVKDAEELPEPLQEFTHFNIRTLLVIPILKDDKTIGIICIASIGAVTDIPANKIRECEELVRAFSSSL